MAGRLPKHARGSATWRHEPQEHFYRRTLAGAVWPQKAENLAPRHRQSQVGHGHFCAVDFTKAGCLDDQVGHACLDKCLISIRIESIAFDGGRKTKDEGKHPSFVLRLSSR